MTDMKVEPVVLEGEYVRLEPMTDGHADALFAAGSDPSLWKWTINVVEKPEDMRAYIASALSDQQRGVSLPLVTIAKDDDSVVGSTRFGNIDPANRRAEIGWTWITPQRQRTRVNTEAKLLMLTHAFEVWKCIRIELKTDVLNEKSRNAILRLGAKQEGIFRNHMITDAGRFRDTVFFSIIDSEWPDVKASLHEKLRSK